jgi:anti-sigma regulatory factor (Ser/Thr protein kinase)
MVRQVLINLFSNAVKFTASGKIQLCVYVVENGIEIGVNDTGCGISDEIYADFESKTTKGESVVNQNLFGETKSNKNEYIIRNSGYGLLLAKRLLKVLQSHLRVRKNGTGGSYFYFILKHTNTNYTLCMEGMCNALIVDDQLLNRKAATLCLMQLCYRFPQLQINISTACSAEEAIRMHTATPFDLIMLDEYYDLTMIKKSMQEKIVSTPKTILVVDNNKEENKTKFREYFDNPCECTFHDSDGKLTGSEIVCDLEQAIVLRCTGSNQIVSPYLMLKPYSVEHIQSIFQNNVDEMLDRGMVDRKNGCVVKNDWVLFIN